jgi:hypothetical protein
MNAFLHFFLFHSVTHTLLYDFITLLLSSFREAEIEILIFVLHNIGLQLRKADPAGIRDLLQIVEQKKNSLAVEIKMSSSTDTAKIDELKRLERKVGFLLMELTDVKNNKGTLTLQVKSVEHLENWIKKRVVGGELAIKPIELGLKQLSEASPSSAHLVSQWWLPKNATTLSIENEGGVQSVVYKEE